MRLPDLDPSGGPLRIKEVLIDYDGPQFFVTHNDGGSRFLGLHTLSPPNSDNWLYVRVSANRISRIISGKVSIRDAFSNPEFGNIALQQLYAGADFESVEELTWHPSNEIGDDYLPDVDSYLQAPDLVSPKNQLAVSRSSQPIQAVVRRANTPMWEFDPAVVDILRAAKTPAHIAATMTRRSVIDLAFSTSKNRTDFPVRSLSAVLGVTQSLIDSLAIDSIDSSNRGPISSSVRGRTALDAVAAFPSSFGIRLETNQGDMADHGPIETALQRLAQLLGAINDSASMQMALKGISKRAQNHFKAFSKALALGKAELKLETAYPGQDSTTRIVISTKDIAWLTKFLDHEVNAIERNFQFKGRLLGVSLRSKFFLLQGEDGNEISGRITKECLSKINEKRINVEHIADILELTEVSEATGEESHKYYLTGIDEVE